MKSHTNYILQMCPLENILRPYFHNDEYTCTASLKYQKKEELSILNFNSKEISWKQTNQDLAEIGCEEQLETGNEDQCLRNQPQQHKEYTQATHT